MLHPQTVSIMWCYKGLLAAALIAAASHTSAQELFVQTEPASNMPAHSVGLRLSNWMMDEQATTRTNYHFIPELMWGVNKNLMVHAEGFFSNRSTGMVAEGVGLYAKYRFYSRDAVYRHFRMAVFGRVSTNNADIHQQEIQTNGHNTGYQLGWVGTQLLHKTALSVTAFYHKATNNFNNNELPAYVSGDAVNYSLSAGKLMLPRTYKNYKQVNLNIMAELLGQTITTGGLHYLDIAPSIQFIFHSQTRLDIGYKYQLYSNMQRTAPNGFVLRLEHLLFNAVH